MSRSSIFGSGLSSTNFGGGRVSGSILRSPPVQSRSSDKVDEDDGDGDDEDEDDDDEEEDGDDEEDVYHWGDRRYTKSTIVPYRRILASLDRAHHHSLNRHVYSAHLLKRRAPPPSHPLPADSNNRPPKKRQKTSSREGDGDHREEEEGQAPTGEKRFLTKQWTAWPLPPSIVPREADHAPGTQHHTLKTEPKRFSFDPATYSEKGAKEEAPSKMLECTIMALFLRAAKDRIRSRDVAGLEPSLDDEVAGCLLRPIVRSIISKFDKLLTGLYLEREGYTKAIFKQRGNETITETLDAAKRVSSGQQPAEREVRSMGLPESEGEEGEGSDDSEGGIESEKQPTRAIRRRRFPAPPDQAKRYAEKRRRALKLRDWSQVLGVASITGWAEDEVQRAAQKCGELFGESMTWRRLGETDMATRNRTGETWTSAGVAPMRPDVDKDGIATDGFMEPIKGIGRLKRKAQKPNWATRKKLRLARMQQAGAGIA